MNQLARVFVGPRVGLQLLVKRLVTVASSFARGWHCWELTMDMHGLVCSIGNKDVVKKRLERIVATVAVAIVAFRKTLGLYSVRA